MNDGPPEISQENWESLATVYKNPDDIDAYPAALSETALPGKLGQLGFWNQIAMPSLNLEHHFVDQFNG